MPDEKPSSNIGNAALVHDVLGAKAFGEIGLVLTKGIVDGAAAFLTRICLPVAEEIGDWGREEIHLMRKRRQNAVRIAERARRVVEANKTAEAHAPPRLVSQIIEIGSWSEEEEVQQMWSGLLASACSPDGRDDSNMIFTDLLSRMTFAQIRLFNNICTSMIGRSKSIEGILVGGTMVQKDSILMERMQLETIEDVHREIEFMRMLGLLRISQLNPPPFRESVEITPTRLALRMFMRCRGIRGSFGEFYNAANPASEEKSG